MVGGHARDVRRERLCRFGFPGRAAALLQFLGTVGGRWNISLFHYRNHGSDFGRVLAALEVPPEEDQAFEGFLKDLGYRFQIEDGNDAYNRFLQPTRESYRPLPLGEGGAKRRVRVASLVKI